MTDKLAEVAAAWHAEWDRWSLIARKAGCFWAKREDGLNTTTCVLQTINHAEACQLLTRLRDQACASAVMEVLAYSTSGRLRSAADNTKEKAVRGMSMVGPEFEKAIAEYRGTPVDNKTTEPVIGDLKPSFAFVEQPTAELRFVRRDYHRQLQLQQRWLALSATGGPSFEWRDVPIEDDQ